jgi:hypothetical protein
MGISQATFVYTFIFQNKTRTFLTNVFKTRNTEQFGGLDPYSMFLFVDK